MILLIEVCALMCVYLCVSVFAYSCARKRVCVCGRLQKAVVKKKKEQLQKKRGTTTWFPSSKEEKILNTKH